MYFSHPWPFYIHCHRLALLQVYNVRNLVRQSSPSPQQSNDCSQTEAFYLALTPSCRHVNNGRHVFSQMDLTCFLDGDLSQWIHRLWISKYLGFFINIAYWLQVGVLLINDLLPSRTYIWSLVTRRLRSTIMYVLLPNNQVNKCYMIGFFVCLWEY